MKITLIRRGKTTGMYWLDDKDEAFLHQSNRKFEQISSLEKLYRCCLYSAEKKDNGEWITPMEMFNYMQINTCNKLFISKLLESIRIIRKLDVPYKRVKKR